MGDRDLETMPDGTWLYDISKYQTNRLKDNLYFHLIKPEVVFLYFRPE